MGFQLKIYCVAPQKGIFYSSAKLFEYEKNIESDGK